MFTKERRGEREGRGREPPEMQRAKNILTKQEDETK